MELGVVKRRETAFERMVRIRLATMQAYLTVILQKEIEMANELTDLQAQVAANTDAEASAVVLLNKLHELLTAAGTDPAKLADLRNQLATSKDALAAAIVANTPAA
jgi:hypothetical protein